MYNSPFKNMAMKRFIAILSLLTTIPLAISAKQPNILLILADDVGQEVLGCYGGQSYDTPQLDALARTGMRFNHMYAMPVCHPTRLTLMTGKYPVRHGSVPWGDFPETEEPHVFSNLLKNAGYQTAIAGKWQLCLMKDSLDHPQRMGFQQSDLFGWHEGPRYYEPMIYRNGQVREDTLGHYGPDLYVRSLIEFMSANRDRPFLAYYSMAVAHAVTNDLKKPVPHGPFDRYDSYREMVEEMDRAVGRLVAALNALELRENTLILFIADNGSPGQIIIRADADDQLIKTPVVSQRDGRMIPGGKGTLLDTGTRVPMIANWSGTIEPGQVVEDLVDLSDFLPTFADLAGVDLPADRELDGHSFAPLLKGTGPSSRKFAYSEGVVRSSSGENDSEEVRYDMQWVRTASWKLYSDGRLFDMRNDDREENPIRKESDGGEQRRARSELRNAFKHLNL